MSVQLQTLSNGEAWVIATPTRAGAYCEGYLQGWASARGRIAGRHFHRGDSDIRRGRNKLTAGFLGTEALRSATGLIFIDDDIGWHIDQIERGARQGVDILGGCYPKKTDDPAQRGIVWLNPRGEHPSNRDLINVDGCGTGFMMIRRRVLETLTHASPVVKTPKGHYWDMWRHEVDPESGTYLTEDYGFCLLARQQGFDVWVDRMIRLSHDNGWKVFDCADAYRPRAIEEVAA